MKIITKNVESRLKTSGKILWIISISWNNILPNLDDMHLVTGGKSTSKVSTKKPRELLYLTDENAFFFSVCLCSL